MEMVAAGSLPNSSRASPDSTNPADGAEITMQSNAWPPLEVTDCSLDGWPNSNIGPTCEPSTSKEAVTQDCDIATPIATHRTPEICGDPLGSHALICSEDQNPFLSGYAQPGAPTKALSKPAENPPTPVEDNPLQYTFRTPPTTGPSFNPSNAERLTYTPSSKTSAETAPDSTVTMIVKESQAAREDFRSSWALLKSTLTTGAGNSEHVIRADVIMRDMDEMRKGILETQAERLENQGRLEHPWPP